MVRISSAFGKARHAFDGIEVGTQGADTEMTTTESPDHSTLGQAPDSIFGTTKLAEDACWALSASSMNCPEKSVDGPFICLCARDTFAKEVSVRLSSKESPTADGSAAGRERAKLVCDQAARC